MKHKTRTYTMTEDIYTCERCGYEVDFKRTEVVCPKHGEFCSECCNKKESRFPLMICPECNITYKEAMSGAHINGPNLQFDKIDLSDPFVVIKDNTSGVWIGSKK